MANERRVGIVASRGGWLTYGCGHGHLMWLPYRLQALIVYPWNALVCLVRGHDTCLVASGKYVDRWKTDYDYPEPRCPQCGAWLGKPGDSPRALRGKGGRRG